MGTFTINLPGGKRLEFDGGLLVEYKSVALEEVPTGRSHEIRAYRTKSGQFVAEVAYVASWEGEQCYTVASVCDEMKDVAEFLCGHDIRKYCRGDIPQLDMQDLEKRYEKTVTEVLKHLEREWHLIT